MEALGPVLVLVVAIPFIVARLRAEKRRQPGDPEPDYGGQFMLAVGVLAFLTSGTAAVALLATSKHRSMGWIMVAGMAVALLIIVGALRSRAGRQTQHDV